MLANILLLFIFYTVNMDIDVNGRKKIYRILPILGIVLIGFSVFYLAVIRPMEETSSLSIYDMLRVDFGRDDVIKYVINKEIIRGERILEYRGETFLSLIGSFYSTKSVAEQTISSLYVFNCFYIELGYSQSARRNNTFSVRNDDLQFWLLGICSWNYLVDLDL